MQVVDARAFDAATTEMQAAVCIVGAGAAGLFMATRLARRGASVVVLEAGGEVCGPGQAIGIEPIAEGARYAAAAEGRSFGLGGTTSRWGGVLVPHLEADVRSAPNAPFDVWRHIVEVVHCHGRRVLSLLGVKPEDIFDPKAVVSNDALETLRAHGLETISSARLPLAKRNFRFLLRELRSAPGNATILLNAPAVSWNLLTGDNQSLVDSVIARAGARLVRVRARTFVVAAGALESTRILLEMERQTRPGLFGKRAALGHYLSDHLSCGVAEVTQPDRDLCARMFAPSFRDGTMRTVRFMDGDMSRSLPRCFFHFIFRGENPGFAVAKSILSALQARRFPKTLNSRKNVGQVLTGFAALAWTRMVRSRLYMPKGAPCQLQLDIEQAPVYSNCMSLSETVDVYGRPRAVIKWKVNDIDRRSIRALASRFLALWPQDDTRFPTLRLAIEDGEGAKLHDAYHPVGTCRMGMDEEAVVDPDLRVRGVSNLSLVSTAVFPTAGTANPTFSMLCLASAVADRLTDDRRL